MNSRHLVCVSLASTIALSIFICFILEFNFLWLLGLDVSRKRDRQSLNTEEMSFQDLVCDITTGQRQKDVTLPFYFICLLHLANEKVCPISSCPVLHILYVKIQNRILNC